MLHHVARISLRHLDEAMDTDGMPAAQIQNVKTNSLKVRP